MSGRGGSAGGTERKSHTTLIALQRKHTQFKVCLPIMCACIYLGAIPERRGVGMVRSSVLRYLMLTGKRQTGAVDGCISSGEERVRYRVSGSNMQRTER